MALDLSGVRIMRSYIPVSWELIEDWPFRMVLWTAEEWAVEVDRLRRIRQILNGQPLVSVKRAATEEVKAAERIRDFPHMTWEDDPWKHQATWEDAA